MRFLLVAVLALAGRALDSQIPYQRPPKAIQEVLEAARTPILPVPLEPGWFSSSSPVSARERRRPPGGAFPVRTGFTWLVCARASLIRCLMELQRP